MLCTLLFVAVIGGSCLHTEALSANKCDKTIIDNIKKTWDSDSNNDIIKKLISYGDLVCKVSTPHYLSDGVKCAYAKYTKEDGKTKECATIVYTEEGNVRSIFDQVTEEGGCFVSKDAKIKRYSVWSKDGVVACYSCYDSDTAAVGPPAGYVMVRKDDYSPTSYKSAIDALEAVGVRVTQQFSDTC